MATCNPAQSRPARDLGVNVRPALGIVAASMVAGMMMGMIEMIIEALGGGGFWAPLRYIASVFTHGADTATGFWPGPVLLGLAGHMMNSLVLTLVFAALVWKLVPKPAVLAALGMAWGAVVFAVMWWVVAPVADPAILLLNPAGFFITHLAFGMVAGLGVAGARRWARTARGSDQNLGPATR